MKEVSAILIADTHLTLRQPVCRLDDFRATLTRKLQWLKNLQKEYDCPIFHGGDLFDHWKTSPELLTFALDNLPDRIVGIAGQHDVEAHSISNMERSGIGVLAAADKIHLLAEDEILCEAKSYIEGFSWGVPLQGATNIGSSNVAIIHKLVYQGKEPFPGAEKVGGLAKNIIKQMPNFKLILSGDCHQTCVEQVGKQLLVNPGSFYRSSASQVDFKPSVFLWHSEDNTVTQVFVPISDGVISREHLVKIEERDERIEAFISKLKPIGKDEGATVNFKQNLRSYMAKNSVQKEIQDIVWETL